MKRGKLELCCLAGAAVSAAYSAGRGIQQNIDIGHLQAFQLSALGVCDITPEAANCWNPSGDLNPSLTDEIKSVLTTAKQSLVFRFGKHDLFLVAKSTGNLFVSFAKDRNTSLRADAIDRPGVDSRYQFVRIDPSDMAASERITATIYGIPNTGQVPIKSAVGSSAIVGGATLTVGTMVTRNNPPNASWLPKVDYQSGAVSSPKEWIYAIGSSNTGNVVSYQFAPLGRSGKPIIFVDRTGKPSSPQTHIGDGSRSNSDHLDAEQSSIAYVRQDQYPAFGAFTVASNVDPQYLGGFSVSATLSKTQSLGPFALRPN